MSDQSLGQIPAQERAIMVVVANPSKSPVFGALVAALGVIDSRVEVRSIDSVNRRGELRGAVGAALCHSRDEVGWRLSNLYAAGCHDAVVAVLGANGIAGPVPELETVTADGQCSVVLPGRFLVSVLFRAQEAGRAAAYGTPACSFLRHLEAAALYRLIDRFCHRGEFDVTNAFLGEMRVLAQHHTYQTRMALDSLIKSVPSTQAYSAFSAAIEAIARDFHLEESAAQLTDLWSRLCAAWQVWSDESKPEAVAELASNLMTILSEIRLHAGAAPSSQVRSGDVVTPVARHMSPQRASSSTAYRVLVVDDHAAPWKPVFEVVATEISEKVQGSVQIDFCTDSVSVVVGADGDDRVDLWKVLPQYDVVLLDVYLPCPDRTVQEVPEEYRNVYGLAILRRIRQRLSRLPVLVWTSSMDRALPAAASQANGFVFKKEATINSIEEAIEPWLRYGQGTRGVSLLNPFFDHVICSSERRQIAIDFTQWALKTMDGLHGLDQFYFRYFNDHGGRHLNGVLCNLEKLIRPVLFASDDSGTFSSAQTGFEQEMMWLYVATLCHDTGMFPLPCDQREVQTRVPEQMRKVRKLHALRTLALFNCSKLDGRSNPHPDLAELLTRLEPSDRLAISLIAAYHSQSSKPDVSLRWLTPPKEPHLEPDAECCLLADPSSSDLENLVRSYVAEVVQEKPDVRLDRFCALLRMADGIDIDFTRLPASHLLADPGRSVLDDCENFKRQVVKAVDVDAGWVNVTFRIANDSSSGGSAREDASGRNLAAQLLAVGPRLAAGDVDALSTIARDELDRYLKAYFESPTRQVDSESCKAISIAAALTVWHEVEERYLGIEAAGLDKTIRLGKPAFIPVEPEELTLLRFDTPYVVRTDRQCPP